MKKCRQCWKPKPLEDFIGKRGGQILWCVDCRKKYRAWQKLSIAERRASMRAKPRRGIGLRVSLVLQSHNRKTGPMPVSMTDMASCPTTCPLRGGGCYAEFGNVRTHWQRVGSGRAISWQEFCRAIAALPPETLWRHNEAGDLPGFGDVLLTSALEQLVAANRGRRGFTFTHKPLRRAEERKAVALANARGFTINLSANSLEHADELAELGIGPVVVVLPSDAPMKMTTPSGRKVIVCPAETSGLTCSTCGLCSKPQRKAIVGFRAHGQARAIVSDLVQLRRKEAAA